MQRSGYIIKAKNSLNYTPQLIIGLDSLNDDANYIHINDVREGVNYYCPCCHGLIKPRACKKDTDYHVQPHFYHESGGCNEETYVHYICKHWLFDKGVKFSVDGIYYVVNSIKTETTLHTSFGDYRPDIIVETTSGKIFYFEIKSTNRKSELYAPKWDELGNDVVEVDVRNFINHKVENEIPEFNLIYSDGECYIKSYTKKEYDETIAARKKEWKRQDKLNYKIQWERLDWFWNSLSRHISNNSTDDEVFEAFSLMSYEDQFWCYRNIKNKSCVSLKDKFKEILNLAFESYLNQIKEDNPKLNISFDQKSKLIYMLNCKCHDTLDTYKYNIIKSFKIRKVSGIFPLSNIDKVSISQNIDLTYNSLNRLRNEFDNITTLSQLPYVKCIHPRSHWASENYPFYELIFVIEFNDYVCPDTNDTVNVSTVELYGSELSKDNIEKLYNNNLHDSLNRLKQLQFNRFLINNISYQEELKNIQKMFSDFSEDYFTIKISSNCTEIVLLEDNIEVSRFTVSSDSDLTYLPNNVREHFCSIYSKVKKYVDCYKICFNQVNNCKNGLWKISCDSNNKLTPQKILYLTIDGTTFNKTLREIRFDNYDNLNCLEKIKSVVEENMKSLMYHMENIRGIRVLEVKSNG